VRYDPEMHQNESASALREACELCGSAGVRFALIGGHAVNLYARPRATVDVDFLVAGEDASRLRDELVRRGFEVLDWRQELGSFVRGRQRIDILIARGAFGLQFLDEAREIDGAPCPVVSPEALIALKLQAFNNDPRRLQDLVDMKALVDARGASLDRDLLRSVFELFDRRQLFEAFFPS
jgi:predicted nucleotidyltransferase